MQLLYPDLIQVHISLEVIFSFICANCKSLIIIAIDHHAVCNIPTGNDFKGHTDMPCNLYKQIAQCNFELHVQ